MLALKEERGFSLVEAVLAATIFGLLTTALIGAIVYGREGASVAAARNHAIFLADEGLEALRNIRTENFANLTDGIHGLSSSSNQWVLTGVPDTSGSFTREIEIGTVNSNTKHATATVTWSSRPGQTSKISIPIRLTKWPFSLPWVNPRQEAVLDVAGLNDGLKIQTQGNYAYLVRNDGTPDFIVFDVSNPASPTQVGSTNLVGAPTNVWVLGNSAYVSSRDNNQELQIVNIVNPAAPTLAGVFNAAGTADAFGVYVIGTTAYLAQGSSAGSEITIIDVSNPAAPTLLGSLNLNDSANGVLVIGSFAYIASAHNSQELQIVNISNPAAPVLVGSLNLAGTANGSTITGFGSTILLGQGTTLRTIDVSNPAGPALLGSLALTGNADDIVLNSDNTLAFLATSNPSLEFQVIDLSSLSSPTLFGSLNLAGVANGVVYHASLNRVFVASASNSEELTVVAPE